MDDPAGSFEPMPGELKAVLGISGLVVILYCVVPGSLVATAATAAKSLF